MTNKRTDFSESTDFIELMFKDKLKRHLKKNRKISLEKCAKDTYLTLEEAVLFSLNLDPKKIKINCNNLLGATRLEEMSFSVKGLSKDLLWLEPLIAKRFFELWDKIIKGELKAHRVDN